MKREDVDINKISPMMKQYLEIKNENLDTILFFRLGDFYEMFFEDAILASRELELTLTGKNCGLSERVPMCGIPYHSSGVYIDKLVEKGYKVAVCEQVSDPKTTKGIVKRDIVQIVSSGTKMNSEFIDEGSNNYIGNILDLNYAFSVSYSDITTGEFNTFIIEHDSENLISEIASRNIKEVVVKSDFDKNILNDLKKQYNITISLYNNEDCDKEYEYIYKNINDERLIVTIKHLISYLNNTQKRSLLHLQEAKIVDENSFLKIDLNSKRNLELVENIKTKERKYSLLWLLDKTKTAMGSRRLKNYLLNPIVSKETLEKRYDIVQTLINEFILKEELRNLLDEVYDLERLIGRISFKTANAKDLLQLKSSIRVLPQINEILKKINYKEIKEFKELYNLLEKSIYEDAPITLKEGYLIKEGYNEELDSLKYIRKNTKEFLSTLEKDEREKTGIKTLRLGYNRVFGYYIEVSKGSLKDIKEEFGYIRKQTLSTGERFITPLLKEKEATILSAEENIINLEYNLFVDIRNTVSTYTKDLQALAKTISEIDVLASLALAAEENNYVRPTINNKNEIDIVEGRHPVIEKVLENTEFVSNDIKMDENTSILLITGPNMAGKSTYMRQMAIIAIMAQIGSFVPAKSASVPIFDQIFTRIGASDDLTRGESTFMVEMMEANKALKNATKNSLILFDELGRGTATYDGMAIASSIVEYIHDKIGAKTFFSTHYHELTELQKNHKHLKNVHVSAVEEDGKLTFLHKVKDGSIDKSYGVHVASLANLPKELIVRAEELLKYYESNDNNQKEVMQMSLSFEEEKKSVIEEKIKKLDILNMSPIEALNYLSELKNELNNKE